MLPFYSFALVDSLLALSYSPEYMKEYDMTTSTFVRFIEDRDDIPDIIIWEMAGNKRDHFFVWSFSLPRANFQTSPNGRVILTGKFVAGEFDCTRDAVSELIRIQEARSEEQFYNGRARVTVLEDTPERKAWHLKVHERFNTLVGRHVEIDKDINQP
ncbi:hypothetical protein V8C42DRAFT_344812 [Trichoderma barbatum]